MSMKPPAPGNDGNGVGWTDRIRITSEAPINAKNPPGALDAATGNGSTDDTTNLQAMLAAIHTAGGGALYLPAGSYRGNLEIPWATVAANEPVGKPVTIQGDGKRTVLKSVAGSNEHVLATENFDTLQGSGDLDGNWRTTIKDLVIDGDQANNLTGGKGLALYGWQCTVQNLIVQNCREEGIHTSWGYGDRPGTGVRGGFDVSMSSYFKSILTQDNISHGWLHHGPHDAIMVGIDSKGNYGWGFRSEVVVDQYNGDGAHIFNLNCWNSEDGGAYFGAGVIGYDIACSSPGGTVGIHLGPAAGPSKLSDITAGASGTGIKVESQSHMIQGLVSGNVTNGLDIDGAFGCIFDLSFINNANAVAFTDDAGNQIIRGRVLTEDPGQTLYTTDPSLYDVIDLVMEGPATGKLMQLGNQEYRGGLRFQAMAAGDMLNNTLFRDSADGKLKWKDNSGVVNALY
jgi:hypothetical protein